MEETNGGNLLALCMANQGASFQVEPAVEGVWYKLRSDSNLFTYSMVAAEPRHIHTQRGGLTAHSAVDIMATNDAALKLIRSFLVEDHPPH